MSAIDRIEHEYSAYLSAKDSVLAYYKDGDKENGFKLHKEVRYLFFTILDLCEQYKELQVDQIHKATENGHAQAGKLRYISVLVSIFVVIIAITLIFFFIQHILEPLRKLAGEASRMGPSATSQNEIKSLSHSVHDLIDDVYQTHTELQKSRETLLQAEKMALVGKLAAGMAHSIRNPFTSVKMRMFSLGRTLKLTETQKDDLDVISQEIRHIDTIVQNFLEFSRPPKLKMQMVSPSVIVDLVIQLLEHRLNSYEVRIEVIRKRPLPPISADPEQLKEVLVNLVVNACEAMKKGGQIVISEEETIERPTGKIVVIRVSDDGPGIPGPLADKVLQPFFTTKEEGTGLGLSIASRIIEEHGGRLNLTSTEGKGTTFTITLPVRD
jgi:signal transduction histidine kinase